MDFFLSIVLLFCLVGLFVCVWGLYCNERTLQQRIKRIMEKKNISNVSYSKHHNCLFFFGNPEKLYDDN